MTTSLQGELGDMSADRAAMRLLGCELWRVIDGKTIKVMIIETEAYDETDAASHSYKGRTPRTDVMFGPAGRLYVYFTYGMHYCCNVVVGSEGYGAAVLIRAVEPLDGTHIVEKRRGFEGPAATNGPAKLCQALGIDKRLNGHDLAQTPLQLVAREPLATERIITTTRVGITKAIDVRWRYYVKDNPYVSKK
jgi:DNA-3-methyladenine glycosylase